MYVCACVCVCVCVCVWGVGGGGVQFSEACLFSPSIEESSRVLE